MDSSCLPSVRLEGRVQGEGANADREGRRPKCRHAAGAARGVDDEQDGAQGCDAIADTEEDVSHGRVPQSGVTERRAVLVPALSLVLIGGSEREATDDGAANERRGADAEEDPAGDVEPRRRRRRRLGRSLGLGDRCLHGRRRRRLALLSKFERRDFGSKSFDGGSSTSANIRRRPRELEEPLKVNIASVPAGSFSSMYSKGVTPIFSPGEEHLCS